MGGFKDHFGLVLWLHADLRCLAMETGFSFILLRRCLHSNILDDLGGFDKVRVSCRGSMLLAPNQAANYRF